MSQSRVTLVLISLIFSDCHIINVNNEMKTIGYFSFECCNEHSKMKSDMIFIL